MTLLRHHPAQVPELIPKGLGLVLNQWLTSCAAAPAFPCLYSAGTPLMLKPTRVYRECTADRPTGRSTGSVCFTSTRKNPFCRAAGTLVSWKSRCHLCGKLVKPGFFPLKWEPTSARSDLAPLPLYHENLES